MELNRKQLSLLITVFSMAIVLLTLYNIRLGAQQEEEYVIEMALDPELFEAPEPEPEVEQQQANSRIKSHLAYNQTMKPAVRNPEPLKTLDELRAEQTEAASSDDGAEGLDDGFASSLEKLRKKRAATKAKYNEKTAETLERMNTVNENTSVSYSLVDRFQNHLPIPIYTCPVGGKVVVNITVDASGRVTSAAVNEKSSSSLNGCLVENAVAYAYKSSFDTSSKASQLGTITYLFQGK